MLKHFAGVIILFLFFGFPLIGWTDEYPMKGMDVDQSNPQNRTMTMGKMGTVHSNGMSGMLGPFSPQREGSGTSWQPDTTPITGFMGMNGNWMFMVSGFATLNYNHQAPPRGEEDFFSTNMLMGMGYGPLGPGTLGLRAMFSLEPTMGPQGYSLLLQTGETGDGSNPLIDRQHPHDLFMELALSYSYTLAENSSVFLYVGYPGEPALGPSAFMHRFSGMEIPIAPITHHWLDSTHVTFGVITGGLAWDDLKLEGSLFTGREPDENRWDFDKPHLDSYSGRLSFNPCENLSMQISYGHLVSPEELDPSTDENRLTASLTYQIKDKDLAWGTMAGWGHKLLSNGLSSNGFLAESTLNLSESHTFFVRVERADKNELFTPSNPLASQIFGVYETTAGYIFDFPAVSHFQFGLGGLMTLDFLPDSLINFYGGNNPLSYLVFGRIKII